MAEVDASRVERRRKSARGRRAQALRAEARRFRRAQAMGAVMAHRRDLFSERFGVRSQLRCGVLVPQDRVAFVGEEVLWFQVAKLCHHCDGQWASLGTGHAMLLKHIASGHVRFLMQDNSSQVLCAFLVYTCQMLCVKPVIAFSSIVRLLAEPVGRGDGDCRRQGWPQRESRVGSWALTAEAPPRQEAGGIGGGWEAAGAAAGEGGRGVEVLRLLEVFKVFSRDWFCSVFVEQIFDDMVGLDRVQQRFAEQDLGAPRVGVWRGSGGAVLRRDQVAHALRWKSWALFLRAPPLADSLRRLGRISGCFLHKNPEVDSDIHCPGCVRL